MHPRRPHADLLAVLLDFLLAVGFEEGFQVAELLFLLLLGLGFHDYATNSRLFFNHHATPPYCR